MAGMTPALRPARFDQTDAEAYAEHLNAAAGGLFTAMFGARAVPIVARVSLQGGTELSLEHVTMAELDGRVVGACSGALGGHADLAGPVLRAAGLRAVRAAAVFLAAWPVMRALERREPGEWYLQSIAVDSDLRGRGVGSALFADALGRARSSGARRLVLDVDAENTKARALYERLGLQVERTSPPARLLGGVRVHRMGCDI